MFNPYSAYKYFVDANLNSGEKTGQAFITVIIVELDIPKLTVNLP